MKKILLALIGLTLISSVAVANHLVDKHAAYETLRGTNLTVLKYLEEQEMGGGHITVTFAAFSTAYMERVTARAELGL
jgi:hypothetical protein